MKKALLGTLTLLAAANFTWASIIFDNFNTDSGHFGFNPTFSGTTANVLATSTTTWDSAPGDLFEGAGVDKIVVNHVATASSSRVRLVSGGPPYTSGTGGFPAFNTVWTFNGSGDGYIGLYLRADTTATGWNVQLNMDSAANTGATMASTAQQTIITDGAWHLYEWAIDPAANWVATPGIGGGSANMTAGSTHTFDSIYFYNTTTIAANDVSTFYIDFVAQNENGSIANLIPEPSTALLSMLGGLGIAWIIRRRTA